MLEIDDVMIGQHSIPIVREVERGSVTRFAEALGLRNPIHFDTVVAQQKGYRNVVAPPTYAVTLLAWQLPGLKLPKAGVLHGEQEFEWQSTICAGDELAVSGWVDNVKSRGGPQGRMTIITIISEATNQLMEFVFRARAVLVVTEGVEHATR